MSYRTVLKWMFLIIGMALVAALIPMCFPVTWMASIHRWLGLGDFPNGPIPVYLARSTSLLYATHGSIMLFVGLDLDRRREFVPLLGTLNLIIGLAMLVIDLNAVMPLYWTLMEGPSIIAGGIAILFLYRKWNQCIEKQR